MTLAAKKKTSATKKALSIALFALAAVLAVVSVAGYILRGTQTTSNNLIAMRTSAVLHAASGGLVNSIASQANATALRELRSRPDFRSMGMDEVRAYCAEAEAAARAEAELLYSNVEGADTTALIARIEALEDALVAFNALSEEQRQAYAALYADFYESVSDWVAFVGDLDDEALLAAVLAQLPALSEAENAHFQAGFVNMARDMAAAQQQQQDEELHDQLNNSLLGLVTDWTALGEAEDLWAALTSILPDLASAERVREPLLASIREQISAVASGEAAAVAAEESAEAEVAEAELVIDYAYFAQSEALSVLDAASDASFEELWAELIVIIPDLNELDDDLKEDIQASIETIAYSSSLDFSARYSIYASENADSILTGGDAFQIQLAAMAEQILIAAIAILLLGLTYCFWKPLTRKLGVPRTIILLFFIYLCLAARLYNINVSLMLGNVLVRVGMYGILVLAMLPGIQCGIGLNMGMTIGCIAGLLATMIALQYNMTGAEALTFSCVVGAVIALPLGWAYSKLLNRMKGNEMTISTYVGFSFVSLMCIGWMLLPFNNPKIIWLLSGRGLRVTHGLLGSFAHLLDNFLAFNVFGIEIPTGLLLFFALCCGAMWLFARSKTGIAMSAAGSNPRFAEASGINVNHMRTIGTTLSTMVAAIGIVIYSQAFGYAQLYTAPRRLGFIAASAILIGGATVSKAKVGHVVIGVFLFEGVLALGQQTANSVVAGGGLSEVMRIMISNGIILYALTQSGGASRE